MTLPWVEGFACNQVICYFERHTFYKLNQKHCVDVFKKHVVTHFNHGHVFNATAKQKTCSIKSTLKLPRELMPDSQSFPQQKHAEFLTRALFLGSWKRLQFPTTWLNTHLWHVAKFEARCNQFIVQMIFEYRVPICYLSWSSDGTQERKNPSAHQPPPTGCDLPSCNSSNTVRGTKLSHRQNNIGRDLLTSWQHGLVKQVSVAAIVIGTFSAQSKLTLKLIQDIGCRCNTCKTEVNTFALLYSGHYWKLFYLAFKFTLLNLPWTSQQMKWVDQFSCSDMTVLHLPDIRKSGLCLLTQRSPEITYCLTHKKGLWKR